jgi:hypothetical protein
MDLVRSSAAAENVLFGGADPAIPNLVPSDIRILRNTFTKNLAWRGTSWIWRVSTSSPYRAAGTDAKDAGADVAGIEAAKK